MRGRKGERERGKIKGMSEKIRRTKPPFDEASPSNAPEDILISIFVLGVPSNTIHMIYLLSRF